MHDWLISSPKTQRQWQDYYELRWRVLREPWLQERGTEKDELENNSTHRIALLKNKVIGVGRIHLVDNITAQIRYMAVDSGFMRQGVGSSILASLEENAKANGASIVILHSRKIAVDFYKRQDYQLIEKSHVLYNQITHCRMKKML